MAIQSPNNPNRQPARNDADIDPEIDCCTRCCIPIAMLLMISNIGSNVFNNGPSWRAREQSFGETLKLHRQNLLSDPQKFVNLLDTVNVQPNGDVQTTGMVTGQQSCHLLRPPLWSDTCPDTTREQLTRDFLSTDEGRRTSAAGEAAQQLTIWREAVENDLRTHFGDDQVDQWYQDTKVHKIDRNQLHPDGLRRRRAGKS
jgi:hypothetical protein